MITYSSHCHRLVIAELISVLFPADLSDSTLSYTETEAASSSNVTPGEFSGGCVSPTVFFFFDSEAVNHPRTQTNNSDVVVSIYAVLKDVMLSAPEV